MTNKQLYKLAVVGDGGVGKSTLIARLVTGEYIAQSMTVGFDIDTWTIMPDDHVSIKVACFDFGGQKQFRFFQGALITGAKAALLVFDCTRIDSLFGLSNWLDLIDFIPSTRKLMVGTKLDATTSLDKSLVRETAEEYGLDYILVSSKTGENIPDLENRILAMVSS